MNLTVELTHPFKHVCYDVNGLLNNVTTLNKFMTNLEKQGMSDPDRYEYNDYVGWGFEALVECLIKLSPIDKRINMLEYTPITEGDMGVDGVGVAHDDKGHTVQCKYRSNQISVLTANKDHISNFVAHSAMKYKADHMTIFTTASKLHEVISEEMYQGSVRTLAVDDLKKLLDNNLPFWRAFKQALTN